MKILYAVQGTGNGHIARARVMAEYLSKRDDIHVDFLFSGRDANKYFDMDVFANYQTRTGLTFSTAKGKVHTRQTIRQARLSRFIRDVRSLDLTGYDLVVNDFEPVSAWAAKLQGVTSVAISHQAALGFDIPKAHASFTDRFITRYFAPSDIRLGVHWYHFGHSIIPPFIHEKAEHTTDGDHILVYLPFEEIEDIRNMLSPLSSSQFICFHPKIESPAESGNIKWFPPSKQTFRDAQYSCAGVIANGGFELSSECLQLGKKLLIKPLTGQYEQASNVEILLQLGLCSSMTHLSTEQVRQWLPRPAPEPVTFPDDPTPMIDWIKEGDWHNTEAIRNTLWEQVRFPLSVERKLNLLKRR